MESVGYFRVLRQYIVLVVVVGLLGVVAASGVVLEITPTYEAQATLFLKVQRSGATSDYERSQFALQRVQSYPALLESPTLLQNVIRKLDLTETPQQLAKQVSASNPTNTVLVNVTADAPTASLAARIANEAANQLSTDVDALENSSTATTQAITLARQITAQAPQSPSSPNVPVLTGLGLLVGLVLGYVLAIILATTRPRLRTADDVRKTTGLPLVAQVPRSSRRATDSGTTIANNLRALGRGTVPPIILLAPADQAAAKPFLRYLIAGGLAQTGRSAIVVETDANSGLPAQQNSARGLSEALLAGRVDAANVVRGAANGVDILPVGDVTVAPPPFKVQQTSAAVIGSIVADYDSTVIQASKSGVPLDLAALAPIARGALLVISRRSTSQIAARQTLARLRVLGIIPIGVLMVDSPRAGIELMETWREEDLVTVQPEATPVPPTPVEDLEHEVDDTDLGPFDDWANEDGSIREES